MASTRRQTACGLLHGFTIDTSPRRAGAIRPRAPRRKDPMQIACQSDDIFSSAKLASRKSCKGKGLRSKKSHLEGP